MHVQPECGHPMPSYPWHLCCHFTWNTGWWHCQQCRQKWMMMRMTYYITYMILLLHCMKITAAVIDLFCPFIHRCLQTVEKCCHLQRQWLPPLTNQPKLGMQLIDSFANHYTNSKLVGPAVVPVVLPVPSGHQAVDLCLLEFMQGCASCSASLTKALARWKKPSSDVVTEGCHDEQHFILTTSMGLEMRCRGWSS